MSNEAERTETINDTEYIRIGPLRRQDCPIRRCHVEFHVAATQREKERLGARNYGHK